MELWDAVLLIVGGVTAGIVNTLAGAGSLLTVPLLVLAGLPGGVANGTNRIGVLLHNLTAAWRFRAEGVPGVRQALPMLLPICLGSFTGAFAIAWVPDDLFEKLFGVLMVLLLPPLLHTSAGGVRQPRQWSAPATFGFFFLVGLYGGAFQAGVGIALLYGLSFTGYDLLRGNSIKVVINAALTAVAVTVFALSGQVVWVPALVLAAGFIVGGIIGVRVAVYGGERVIRPVLVAAVIALAGRMLGLY
ncbi:sulfite exporter TauE/SafE family protein [Candidatus Binatia bacterium]|nr:sulfite exporter TauE/SafE family protein [Candidatus Binatia bacterium]